MPLLERDYNGSIVESLLRLSETARGAQSVVEELVEELLADTVEFDNDLPAVIIRRDELAGVNLHVVRELFVRVWRDMGWPEQNMGLEDWDELAIEAAVCTADEDDADVWVLDDYAVQANVPRQDHGRKKRRGAAAHAPGVTP